MKTKKKQIVWMDEAGNNEEHEALLEIDIFPLPEGIITERWLYLAFIYII